MAEESTTLDVRVQPGSKRGEVIGFTEGVLKIRVSSPPREGRANEAAIALLAARLGIRRAALSIARGHSSRSKVIVIEGLSSEEVRRRLGF